MAGTGVKTGGSRDKTKGPRTQINRNYYLRNRDKLLAKANRRYAQAQEAKLAAVAELSKETQAPSDSESGQRDSPKPSLFVKLTRLWR